MDDFERVRTSGKEVTADMIERARKPELEVDPKDVTELLHSYDKTFNRWGVVAYGWAKNMVSWDEIYSWWRCRESCRNDNIGFRISNINLVDKAEAELERIDSKLESSPMGKVLSNSISCYGEIVHERVNWRSRLHGGLLLLLSRLVVSDSATPWTAARQASLSFTISWSLLKLNVHWVGDTIQPSLPLSSPSLPAFDLSQHQGLFQWVGYSHQVAQVLELQLQHQSFHWIFRVDFL